MSRPRLTRRNLLQAAAVAASPLAFGAAPPPRVLPARFRLSLAAYSFNSLLPRRGDDAAQAAAPMRLEDFVEFCAQHGLDACEPTAYYFPKSITPEYLLALKRKAFMLGLDLSGTAIGNNFCHPPGPDRDREWAETREWIDHAAALGAPVIRIFAGKQPPNVEEAEAVAWAVEGINASVDYAASKGVCLALENHGGITETPEQMLNIIQKVADSPWFGVNFDSGNFRTEDPYAALEMIAPYAINAQLKVSMHPKGRDKERADFRRILEILRAAQYRGYVVLEYEEKEDPRTAIPPLLDELRTLL